MVKQRRRRGNVMPAWDKSSTVTVLWAFVSAISLAQKLPNNSIIRRLFGIVPFLEHTRKQWIFAGSLNGKIIVSFQTGLLAIISIVAVVEILEIVVFITGKCVYIIVCIISQHLWDAITQQPKIDLSAEKMQDPMKWTVIETFYKPSHRSRWSALCLHHLLLYRISFHQFTSSIQLIKLIGWRSFISFGLYAHR